MLAVALALASSLCWGLSDFIGGLQSRRQALLAVLWISQGVGAAHPARPRAAAGVPTAHDGAATAWAAGAGILGLCALTAFYRALSIGTMSIVAPLSATGTAIPVLVGLASGDAPSGLQAAGMALAACWRRAGRPREPGADAAARRASRRSIVLALVAAVGFGSFFAMLDRAEQSADVTWVLLAARVPSVALLTLAIAWRRPPLPREPPRGARSSSSASSTCWPTSSSRWPRAAACSAWWASSARSTRRSPWCSPACCCTSARGGVQNVGVAVVLAGVLAIAAG